MFSYQDMLKSTYGADDDVYTNAETAETWASMAVPFILNLLNTAKPHSSINGKCYPLLTNKR